MLPEHNQQGESEKQHWFATTHWTVVRAAGDGASTHASNALEQLCRLYWPPLYAYVRRKGYGPQDAEDLTQAFFVHLLEKDCLARANRYRGRFRTFLLSSLQNFLNHEWERARAEKRGGGRTFIPWSDQSPESHYQLEAASDSTPDKLYEQRWAIGLFQRALSRLREDLARAGKSDQFEQLKGFLTAEPAAGEYARVATRLGLPANGVAVAVHRLRQRYGELVREEVVHTVDSPADVEDELRYLIKLLSG